MTRVVRLVQPGGDADAPPVTMDEALQALATRVAGDRPPVVLVVWEMPNGKLRMESLPPSRTVTGGLVTDAWAHLHPEPEPDEPT